MSNPDCGGGESAHAAARTGVEAPAGEGNLGCDKRGARLSEHFARVEATLTASGPSRLIANGLRFVKSACSLWVGSETVQRLFESALGE